MHMKFKTRVPDSHVETSGIRGIIDNHIEWMIGSHKKDWYAQKDFGSYYKSTNVMVHWGVYIVGKGKAGMDISFTVEKIEGDHIFEFINDDDKDDLMMEFKIDDDVWTEWEVEELRHHHDCGETTTPIGEVYARSIELDFVAKKISVYFG